MLSGPALIGRGPGHKSEERVMRPALRDDPRNLVEKARRAHLYPSRTQKLSAAAATIVRECDNSAQKLSAAAATIVRECDNSAPPGSERTGRSFFFCPE